MIHVHVQVAVGLAHLFAVHRVSETMVGLGALGVMKAAARAGEGATRAHRVLFLEAGSGAGGSTTSLCYRLSHLDRSRFEPIVVFYFFNRGPDTERLRQLGVQVEFVSRKASLDDYALLHRLGPASRGLLHWPRVLIRALFKMFLVNAPQLVCLVRLLKARGVGLVVLNNDVHYHVVGVLASRIRGVPCICRKAGGIGEGRGIKRVVSSMVNCFVAISHATATDQLAMYPGTRRLEVIHPAIDLSLYTPGPPDPATRVSLGLHPGRKVAGCISRFNTGKGLREFVRAASIVARERTDVDFLIVGDGNRRLADDLANDAVRLGLQDSLILPGWRRDISATLGCMDVFVHVPTTWIEGFGIATLEAMAMGKPVIVSRNGGLAESVIDGESGLIVEVGDVEGLASALLKVLGDPALAASLGANARRRAEREFDARRQVRRWEHLFSEYLVREQPGRITPTD